ncbi:hypothetical protein QFZ77_007548 [Paenibacillus sp. V4I3]|uniref:DUF3888 domain-containing protein n=1 Tax=unclassified Paenibacillus TaxID=185978 RepID=UPI00277DCD99|nr:MULTISPECIES: DUF3888 domain-containing protein [unclassified Paenibacillus]MDQ0878889.1 hypothetical protein [Paenibacillus sp. V4I3]MDQ0888787.1 hypothetical protein [Paenibacillus sp. V4I9]
MRKSIIALILAITLIIPIQNKTVLATKPTQDSTQLKLQDMLMVFLTPYIYKDVSEYYKSSLKFNPIIEPWRIDVIQAKRVTGFRGFDFSLIIEVEPTVGQHVLVGKDRIEYQLSFGPSVKLIKFTHLTTYELPPDLKDILR